MKQLIFPAENYIFENGYLYKRTEESIIGKLELLWTVVQRSTLEELTERDHKVNRRLKKKIREVTRFKDKDEDARVSKFGSQIILLEEDELDLLKRHFKAMKFSSAASEDSDDLLTIINEAKDYQIPKPELVEADDNN